MIKDAYLQEIHWKGAKSLGDRGNAVLKAQQFVTLYRYFDPTWPFVLEDDGIFGPMTQTTIRLFQEHKEIEPTGVLDDITFNALCQPMRDAFDMCDISKKFGGQTDINPRDVIVEVAKKHLRASPRELHSRNIGPWVRAYMGGRDGSHMLWCVGSPITIIDQALSAFEMKFTDYLPDTLHCDTLGNYAKKHGRLIRNRDLVNLPQDVLKANVLPGDLINVQKGPRNWRHTAMLIKIVNDNFITWEGNTNDEGSSNGYEACMRIRNYKRQKLDVIQLGID